MSSARGPVEFPIAQDALNFNKQRWGMTLMPFDIQIRGPPLLPPPSQVPKVILVGEMRDRGRRDRPFRAERAIWCMSTLHTVMPGPNHKQHSRDFSTDWENQIRAAPRGTPSAGSSVSGSCRREGVARRRFRRSWPFESPGEGRHPERRSKGRPAIRYHLIGEKPSGMITFPTTPSMEGLFCKGCYSEETPGPTPATRCVVSVASTAEEFQGSRPRRPPSAKLEVDADYGRSARRF
jgi:hypothetical protein